MKQPVHAKNAKNYAKKRQNSLRFFAPVFTLCELVLDFSNKDF
jgi:hypothetical protein